MGDSMKHVLPNRSGKIGERKKKGGVKTVITHISQKKKKCDWAKPWSITIHTHTHTHTHNVTAVGLSVPSPASSRQAMCSRLDQTPGCPCTTLRYHDNTHSLVWSIKIDGGGGGGEMGLWFSPGLCWDDSEQQTIKKKKKKKECMIGPHSLGCWSIWLRLLIRDDDTKNTRQPSNLDFSCWFVSTDLQVLRSICCDRWGTRAELIGPPDLPSHLSSQVVVT